MKRSFASLLGVALLVVGCGSEDVGTSAGVGQEYSSPIGEFLGLESFDNSEDSQARYIAQERDRQEVIATCMRSQGFDYIPIDQEQFIFYAISDELEIGSDEWIEKYGFGITTTRFSQEEVGPDLVGHNYNELDREIVDPNQAAIEQMTPSRQEAYYTALLGEQNFPEFDETLTEEEMRAQSEGLDFQPAGCEGEAYRDVNNSDDRFYQEFSDELEALYERVENDPRSVAARQEISDCVVEKGLEYSSEEDVYKRFNTELSLIDQSIDHPGMKLTEEDFASMSEDELNAILNQRPVLSAEALAMLAELQDEERRLAKAFNECGGGFANQDVLYQDVRAEYEQQFLVENQDRLADYKADN